MDHQTLVLHCETWRGNFYAVAEGFPFVPRMGDHISITSNIRLTISILNPQSHWVKDKGIYTLTKARTTSRQIGSLEEVKNAFHEDGWLLTTEERMNTIYPFFS